MYALGQEYDLSVFLLQRGTRDETSQHNHGQCPLNADDCRKKNRKPQEKKRLSNDACRHCVSGGRIERMENDLFSFATQNQTSKPLSKETEMAAYLRSKIDHHNELYYVKAEPEISDFEFDKLLQELIALETKHPELITPDSPTQRVGGRPVSEFKSFEHVIPMQSLENTYARGELVEFDKMIRDLVHAESLDYVVEPKIDGLAFSLHYKDGVLTTAATRGNGEVGDEITANVRTIRTIPLRIPTDAHYFEARGEIYMPKAGFLKLTESQIERGEEPFKNPRNAAAGSIKLLDPSLTAKRPLNAILYGVGIIDGIPEPSTHAALTEKLRELGLPAQPRTWTCHGIAKVLEAIDELETMRHEFPFEMDGAVVKVNDRTLYKKLGSTAKAPRWARAYKYAPEQAETVIEAITVQVGRTGVLTPVAELRTVRLAGSDISRATLHNEDEIRRKDIRIGDHVMIEKAGEVIPAVVAVLPEKRTGSEIEFTMPTACPVCGDQTIRRAEEVAIRCTNFLCPAQLVARVQHFASRDALDIEGLGEKVAAALVEQNLISNPMDLFGISEILLSTLNLESSANYGSVKNNSNAALFQDEVNTSSGRVLGESNAKTIMEAIRRSKTLPLGRWIYAIGIPGIGAKNARDLADLHKNFEDFTKSEIIADAERLYDLMDAADANNPNTQRVRAMDVSDRVECADKYALLSDEIEALGSRMVAAGTARSVKGSALKFTADVKPEACRAIHKFFNSDYGRDFVERMNELGINPVGGGGKSTGAPTGSFFDGKTVVITGSFHDGLDRNTAADLITNAGGKVVDSVSKNTDYLIIGDNPGASKTNKASHLGTKTMDESEMRVHLALPAVSTQSPSLF